MAVEDVFSALGDPTRREVLASLAGTPASASALADVLPVSRQAVAKHLAILESVGLVAARREGREVVYEVRTSALRDAAAWLRDTGDAWDRRLARLARRR